MRDYKQFYNHMFRWYAKTKTEEAPTNAAGGGAIHGIGVGPYGEPGVHKKAAKKYKKKQDDVEKGRKLKIMNFFKKYIREDNDNNNVVFKQVLYNLDRTEAAAKSHFEKTDIKPKLKLKDFKTHTESKNEWMMTRGYSIGPIDSIVPVASLGDTAPKGDRHKVFRAAYKSRPHGSIKPMVLARKKKKKSFKVRKEQMLDEMALYDPAIFKAFFMAGGPASGKSFIARNTFTGTGLKFVNSDIIFERGLKNAKLNFEMPKSEEEQRDRLRNRAKLTANSQLETYVDGRLGLVIDATGRDYDVISRQYKMLTELGYDCYMLFVNTSLGVALERQKKREREVPEYIVKKSWKGVQENIGKFQSLFKRTNFLIVDNNVSAQETVTIVLRKLYQHTMKLIGAPVHSYIAKNWIEKERIARKRV
tara:strand:+ start:109 stop:1362 length:1254 start_codon:yes stop_codon:yes gene_type:complete